VQLKTILRFRNIKLSFVILTLLIIFSPKFMSSISSTTSINSSSVIGEDNRVRITPTDFYPWSSVVKLHINFGSYSTFGSGVLIDKSHVLTAAHCVYSYSSGVWAESIKVVPGQDFGFEPFGHAWATNYRCYNQWVDDGYIMHDFALITLDRNIGLLTGWMELYCTVPMSSIYTGTLYTAGYPYDLDYGYNMYYCSENGHSADEYIHWYYLDVEGGQSGSPIFIYSGETGYILSIAAYSGTTLNYGPRINRVKYDCINNWLVADTGVPIKPDLTVESTIHAGYNTSIIGPNSPGISIWSTVRNIGCVYTLTASIAYYASTDTQISTSDYLIGVDTLSTLNPTDTATSTWSGIFPATIPSGEYYIGWIVDPNDQITEFNEDNNKNVIWSQKVFVDNTSPSNPTACTQTNGVTESNIWQNGINNPSFTWQGARDAHSDVEGYYYYWGSDPYGTSDLFTSNSEITPQSVDSGIYYLRIQTKDSLGNLAPWQTQYIFKYDNTPPSNPLSCTQLTGTIFSDEWQDSVNDPYFNWSDGFDAHSGIHGYYVYWGADSNGAVEYFSVAPNFDPPPVQTGTYYLRIQTVDNLGNSAPWSTIYTFKYNATLNLVIEPPPDDFPEEEPDNPDATLEAINIINLFYLVNFLIIIGCVAIITYLTLKNVLTKRKL